MDKRIYPAYKIAMLSSVLREHGVPASALLDGTGLSDNEITSLTTRISQRQLVIAYRNAQNLSQISYIGLLAGSRLRVTDYGIYGYGLISSANLREALEFSIQYHEMAAPTVRMSLWVEEERGLAVFGLADHLNIDEIYRFNVELQFGLVFSLFKEMVGDDFLFEEIYATMPRPDHAKEYAKLFRCPVSFERERNEMRFPVAWLERPLIRANPITAELSVEICNRILLEMSMKEGVAEQVGRILLQSIGTSSDIESMASNLNMSSRTLNRKLAQQGTSFHKILVGVRRELAIKFLRNTNLSLDEIAFRLGFSEAANFRRAFKKWTGRTASSYRQCRR